MFGETARGLNTVVSMQIGIVLDTTGKSEDGNGMSGTPFKEDEGKHGGRQVDQWQWDWK